MSQSLVEPRQEYRVRDIDPTFVSMLKTEITERPNTFAKPLIAIVKNVVTRERFDESQIDGLSLEVIGGNHRREALAQLIKEGQLKQHPLSYTMVQLYTGKSIAIIVLVLMAMELSLFFA